MRAQLNHSDEYNDFRRNILLYPHQYSEYSVTQDLVLYKARIWLPRDLPIIQTLLQEFHSTPTGGHAGVAKTTARILNNFYWPKLREDVTRFVALCRDCQVTKYESKKATGLLCPLPTPHRPWDDLSMDFIVGLPAYKGNTMINDTSSRG